MPVTRAPLPLPSPSTQQMRPLHTLALNQPAWITAVGDGSPATPEQTRQLTDLGFVPGEPVEVVARAWPGGDPLAVRVGQARFALRCAEAACVLVSLQAPSVALPGLADLTGT